MNEKVVDNSGRVVDLSGRNEGTCVKCGQPGPQTHKGADHAFVLNASAPGFKNVHLDNTIIGNSNKAEYPNPKHNTPVTGPGSFPITGDSKVPGYGPTLGPGSVRPSDSPFQVHEPGVVNVRVPTPALIPGSGPVTAPSPDPGRGQRLPSDSPFPVYGPAPNPVLPNQKPLFPAGDPRNAPYPAGDSRNLPYPAGDSRNLPYPAGDSRNLNPNNSNYDARLDPKSPKFDADFASKYPAGNPNIKYKK